ncbi:MAG: glycosyl hydrolase family 28-related protein, partial [Patescibacteria group bacterium]|nr:glycosyl hydrolase family 28-related protein [Patescibacteria group bacterium]
MKRWSIPLALVVVGAALVACRVGPADEKDLTGSARPSGVAGPLQTVCDFGASGDGEADDSEAIQRAVDSGKGDILFPRGVYRITRPIEIDLATSGPIGLMGTGTATIVMAGPGPAFRFRGSHGGTAAPRTVQPRVWQRERTPTADGLEIVGEHEEAVGVEASGTMQLTLTRLTIRRTRHAIHLVERNRNVIVANC